MSYLCSFRSVLFNPMYVCSDTSAVGLNCYSFWEKPQVAVHVHAFLEDPTSFLCVE